MNDIEEWLLDSDPALRWQVLEYLGASPLEVAEERSKIADRGLGASLLSLQAPDGRWGGTAWNHGWNSTMHALTLLKELGLDPASDAARNAAERVRENVTWRGCGPDEVADNAFFEGETEPCINGQVAASGAYFRQDVRPLIRRLLGEQLPDGGWNCEEHKAHSSFNTTICVLEALLEFERAFGDAEETAVARARGQDYLLDRAMFRRLSTGAAIELDRKGKTSWASFAFPCWWHYDVLRGLDYLQRAGVEPDERAVEAVALVTSRRGTDGRWLLGMSYPGTMPVDLGETEGSPSRWITLRALRVQRWFSRDGTS